MIRRMEIGDLPFVADIEQSTFSRPWSLEDFLSSMSKESNIYLVADQDGQVAGYCGLWGVLDEGQITNVAVKEEYRSKKIGSELLRALIAYGRKEGLREFTLEVRESNRKAIHLYEKIGFRKEGLRKNFYENPTENGVIMWLRQDKE